MLIAFGWHAEVVEILLGRTDINPDKPGKYGRTTLPYALAGGHAQVIVLLQPPTAVANSTA